MAFKIKRFIPDSSPINIIDPGKVLKAASSTLFPVANTIVDGVKGVSNTVKAYKARNYKASIDSEPKVKKTSGRGEGTGQGSGSSIKGTSADTRTYDPFSKKTNVKKVETKAKKTGGYVKKGGTSTGNIKDYKVGTQARRDEYTARGWKQDSTTKTNSDSTTQNKPIAEVTKTKGVSIGLKPPKASDVKLSQKPTVKAAPKDNSRKAIRKRKKEDKAAGVSKSQMRANKAKSKSEAASAKAKKSKNPSYRAQLTAKSERLAKRAERKGGSPVKATRDLKDPKKTYGKVTVKKAK